MFALSVTGLYVNRRRGLSLASTSMVAKRGKVVAEFKYRLPVRVL